jgi:hypothetical protein
MQIRAILVVLVAFQLCCRETATALAPDRAARTGAEDLFTTLSARFGPRHGDSLFNVIRMRFARGALTPSKVYREAALWTGGSGNERILEIYASGEPSNYTMGLQRGAPPPTHRAEYRQLTRLAKLRDDEYLWRVLDELALGTVRVDRLSSAVTTLFSGVERVGPGDARPMLRAGLPRTWALMGKMFALDTLRVDPAQGGGKLVLVSARLQPEGLGAEAPQFARWVRRYFAPSNFHVAVSDPGGALWWEGSYEDGRMTLRCRVAGGSLAPLQGAPRQIPDSLRVTFDVLAKAWVFRVGFHELVGDVRLMHPGGERGFEATFQREPHWQLPPMVSTMIRSPLARPFAGEGTSVGFSVHDGDGEDGPSIVERHFRFPVQESDLMRWFGGLSNAALTDFRGQAEAEADRYIGSVFIALRDDTMQLAGSAPQAQQ